MRRAFVPTSLRPIRDTDRTSTRTATPRGESHDDVVLEAEPAGGVGGFDTSRVFVGRDHDPARLLGNSECTIEGLVRRHR